MVSLQPPRLNVFKNDQDTWDYTNPTLSGQGKAHMRAHRLFLGILMWLSFL